MSDSITISYFIPFRSKGLIPQGKYLGENAEKKSALSLSRRSFYSQRKQIKQQNSIEALLCNYPRIARHFSRKNSPVEWTWRREVFLQSRPQTLEFFSRNHICLRYACVQLFRKKKISPRNFVCENRPLAINPVTPVVAL